ncbi:hypothetical protein HYFRA_00012402 [Hymenoscyphus fraxineus]|uniref:Uncharacterized protein n=1 Tax=Hymenoscyphus fraxineus TaxID=746836 RepID=A0A9N9L996_9HELO|nr:hypothetical protein HYFRA_00012402 [Hymenoscyphus fraxineus]
MCSEGGFLWAWYRRIPSLNHESWAYPFLKDDVSSRRLDLIQEESRSFKEEGLSGTSARKIKRPMGPTIAVSRCTWVTRHLLPNYTSHLIHIRSNISNISNSHQILMFYCFKPTYLQGWIVTVLRLGSNIKSRAPFNHDSGRVVSLLSRPQLSHKYIELQTCKDSMSSKSALKMYKGLDLVHRSLRSHKPDLYEVVHSALNTLRQLPDVLILSLTHSLRRHYYLTIMCLRAPKWELSSASPTHHTYKIHMDDSRAAFFVFPSLLLPRGRLDVLFLYPAQSYVPGGNYREADQLAQVVEVHLLGETATQPLRQYQQIGPQEQVKSQLQRWYHIHGFSECVLSQGSLAHDMATCILVFESSSSFHKGGYMGISRLCNCDPTTGSRQISYFQVDLGWWLIGTFHRAIFPPAFFLVDISRECWLTAVHEAQVVQYHQGVLMLHERSQLLQLYLMVHCWRWVRPYGGEGELVPVRQLEVYGRVRRAQLQIGRAGREKGHLMKSGKMRHVGGVWEKLTCSTGVIGAWPARPQRVGKHHNPNDAPHNRLSVTHHLVSTPKCLRFRAIEECHGGSAAVTATTASSGWESMATRCSAPCGDWSGVVLRQAAGLQAAYLSDGIRGHLSSPGHHQLKVATLGHVFDDGFVWQHFQAQEAKDPLNSVLSCKTTETTIGSALCSPGAREVKERKRSNSQKLIVIVAPQETGLPTDLRKNSRPADKLDEPSSFERICEPPPEERRPTNLKAEKLGENTKTRKAERQLLLDYRAVSNKRQTPIAQESLKTQGQETSEREDRSIRKGKERESGNNLKPTKAKNKNNRVNISASAWAGVEAAESKREIQIGWSSTWDSQSRPTAESESQLIRLTVRLSGGLGTYVSQLLVYVTYLLATFPQPTSKVTGNIDDSHPQGQLELEWEHLEGWGIRSHDPVLSHLISRLSASSGCAFLLAVEAAALSPLLLPSPHPAEVPCPPHVLSSVHLFPNLLPKSKILPDTLPLLSSNTRFFLRGADLKGARGLAIKALVRWINC